MIYLFIEFDYILFKFDLLKVMKKHVNDYIIIHFNFKFNFIKIQVSLSSNKKLYILNTINSLFSISIISLQFLELTLDFLFYYY